MKKITLVLFGLFLLLLTNCKDLNIPPSENSHHTETTIIDDSVDDQYEEELPVLIDELMYNGKRVIITKHAACRMKCRFINKKEIQEIINKGKYNEKKSDMNPSNPKYCPSYVYEERSYEDQKIRIVMAHCDKDDFAKLVTVIDLENEYKCNCK